VENLVTQVVEEAWDQFTRSYQELVVETFWQLGLTLSINGSCNNKLFVKGIESSYCTLAIGRPIRSDKAPIYVTLVNLRRYHKHQLL